MNNLLVNCAKEVLEAYNSGVESRLVNCTFELNKIIHRHPRFFVRNDHPLIVFIALYRSLKIGGLKGADSIFTAYYCMLRSLRESSNIEKIESAMYGFLFLDSNIGLLQLVLLEKIQNPETVQKILYQQLSLSYVLFKDSINSIELDTQTSSLLANRMKMYNDIVRFNLNFSQMQNAENTIEKLCDSIKEELEEKEIEIEEKEMYRIEKKNFEDEDFKDLF